MPIQSREISTAFKRASGSARSPIARPFRIDGLPLRSVPRTGVLEIPYLSSLGVRPRVQGRAAIAADMTFLRGHYLDFTVRPEDIHVLIDTPGTYLRST